MIGNAISEALPALRAEAESLLTDPCIIERRTGSAAIDPLTGHASSTWSAVWSGMCRIRTVSSVTSTAIAGGESASITVRVLSLPVSAPAPLIGYRATVATVTDRPLYVVGVPYGSQTVLRRVQVSDELVADR